MVLELHIWGPAFSLPSIDPHCLTAIAYLAQALPRDQWVLVASSDATLSPTKELPVLQDGSATIGGFENIVDYLRKRSDGDWDIDRQFSNPKDRADVTAFSSFLTSQAHPLLDLSLYVASENYSKTRTAYSSILQWPTQYFVPPQRRTIAKARTEHMGLSSLDLDTLDEERRSSRKAADLIPQSLRTSRPTVTGLMKEKQSSARFKLDALVDAAFKPLEQLLGKKKWMLSDERASSLDCVALGYLSLAFIPEMPLSWLAEGLRGRYPDLCKYVEDGVKEVFGGKVTVEDALLSSTGEQSAMIQGENESGLPWRAPEQNLSSAGASILNSTFDSVPFYKRTIVTTSSTQPQHSTDAPPHSLTSTLLPPLLASAGAVAAIASYLLYSNLSKQEPEKRNLSDMGEAGAMFAGLDFGEPKKEVRVPPAEGRVPVGVEVDIEGVGERRGL
ncbi:hypothetical protein HO173_007014 [Letharia columbiana]|uniref:Mitochondrial import receptor subunit n=1 Tax=Letharia columbiana TaxID=112416 RepID=A0A8H6L424_9LECA|nr:uncharacterized protein HO173_007014 [Letharia columbiana]KAF6234794.1 hypothetical protein HO173_007014 [Letharia columbiana]